MQSLWMIVAAFLFSIMGVFVKLATDAHNIWEILFWRSLVGLMVLLPILNGMQGGVRAGLTTKYWSAHTVRNLAGTLAVTLWFASIGHLPLATSMTLNYSSSLFIGLGMFISAAWAGRSGAAAPTPPGRMLAALLVGFAGVVLVLRPTLSSDQWVWALVALTSGGMAAVALMTVRALGALGEPASRVVFYFTLTGLVAALLGMLVAGAHRPDLRHLAYLLGVGVCAVLAQLAMTRAYTRGQALLVANLTYMGILFASLWGWWLWHDSVPPIAILGMVLVVAAGIAATLISTNTPAAEPQ